MFGFGKKKKPSPPLPLWKKGLKLLWLCTRIVLWSAGMMITGLVWSIYLPNGLFGGVELELLIEDMQSIAETIFILSYPLSFLFILSIPFALLYVGFSHRASSMRQRRRM